jgi:hypothetical protein
VGGQSHADVDRGRHDEPGFWTYTYEFQDNDPTQPKDLSHLIIEVSASFTASDIQADTPDVSSDSSKTFGPSDPSNPSIPGDIYGVKWNADGGTDFTATLVTARAPVWGDFYVKDGKTDQVDNAAWNTGFLNVDPLDLPANGSIDNHALVPDTDTTPVPEPGTLLLVGTGLASVGAWAPHAAWPHRRDDMPRSGVQKARLGPFLAR